MGDGGREGHKDTDGVSFVANIYAISYPYTSPVGSFVPPGFSSGREAGCYLNFPFRSCNSSPSPFPTINYNEATISVSTNTEFSFPPISPIIPRQFFYLIGRLAARQVAKLLPLKAVINDSAVSPEKIKIFFVPKRGIGATEMVVEVCKIDPKCVRLSDNVQRGMIAPRRGEESRIERKQEIYGNR